MVTEVKCCTCGGRAVLVVDDVDEVVESVLGVLDDLLRGRSGALSSEVERKLGLARVMVNSILMEVPHG